MTDTLLPDAGPLPLVDGPLPQTEEVVRTRKAPAAGVAARLLRAWHARRGSKSIDVVFLAGSERRADEIARALEAMGSDGGPDVLVFPPWDCLPYDRAAPSRESMGRRMAVLSRLAEKAPTGRLVITSPEAVMQRVPPKEAASARFDLLVGDSLDRQALQAFALRCGFVEDERIDEPGEIAFLGEVIDVYPPGRPSPARIVVDADDTITEIRSFDPVSQRSQDLLAGLVLTPASERISEEADDNPLMAGGEHRLPEHYESGLSTLFDYAAAANILMEAVVPERVERFAALVTEAFESRHSFGAADGSRPLAPERLYLKTEEIAAALGRAEVLDVERIAPTPAFALERTPGAAVKRYLIAQSEAGRAVVLTGLAHEQRVVARLLKRNGVVLPAPLDSWPSPTPMGPDDRVTVIADLDSGYEDHQSGWTVLTPTDITGGRLARASASSETSFGEIGRAHV